MNSLSLAVALAGRGEITKEERRKKMPVVDVTWTIVSASTGEKDGGVLLVIYFTSLLCLCFLVTGDFTGHRERRTDERKDEFN